MSVSSVWISLAHLYFLIFELVNWADRLFLVCMVHYQLCALSPVFVLHSSGWLVPVDDTLPTTLTIVPARFHPHCPFSLVCFLVRGDIINLINFATNALYLSPRQYSQAMHVQYFLDALALYGFLSIRSLSLALPSNSPTNHLVSSPASHTSNSPTQMQPVRRT